MFFLTYNTKKKTNSLYTVKIVEYKYTVKIVEYKMLI